MFTKLRSVVALKWVIPSGSKSQLTGMNCKAYLICNHHVIAKQTEYAQTCTHSVIIPLGDVSIVVNKKSTDRDLNHYMTGFDLIL